MKGWLLHHCQIISQCREEELIIQGALKPAHMQSMVKSSDLSLVCLYRSQIMTQAVNRCPRQSARTHSGSTEPRAVCSKSNTSVRKMSFGVEEWWLANRLVIVCNHQPSTTNIRAGLCWIFNACQVCIEMGRTALPDSLGDTLAVGFVGCILTRSEQSAAEERLCHCSGHFLPKTNGVRPEQLPSNRMHAITSRASMTVKLMRGKYIDLLLTVQGRNGHAELQEGALPQTVLCISSNDAGHHVGRNMQQVDCIHLAMNSKERVKGGKKERRK